MKFSCPSCGAEVIFKSSFSFWAVCSYCSSTILRRDKNIELLGKVAELPPDLSPIQIGSTGIFEGNKFEVIGRQKITYSEGIWNEWYLMFANGKDGWLAEAQGEYIMSFQFTEKTEIPKRKSLKINQGITIGKIKYNVTDIKEIECIGSEGELPFPSPAGRKSISIDMSFDGGNFCNIDFKDNETNIFVGSYIEFELLEMKNLKKIEGWD